MILFANDPPIYRDAMATAFRSESEKEARALPNTLRLDRAISDMNPATVILSEKEDIALLISRQIPVINLTNAGGGEQGSAYVAGELVTRRTLGGFPDLVDLIGSLEPVGDPAS